METIFRLYAFLLGSALGSFSNACIYRLPKDFSVVSPRSMCTKCGSRVAAYDNIPLLSYWILRGRCRTCGSPFSARYFFVELLVALLSLWIYCRLGLSLKSVYLLILATSMVIVSAIDLEYRIIPNVISISGIWIGVCMAGLAEWLGIAWWASFVGALAGAAAGGALLWGVGWIYEQITGREGIGMGDVKLLALFGANSGLMGVFTSLFVASLLGSIVGLAAIVLMGKDRKYPIPFGPFLSIGFLTYLFFGSAALDRPMDVLLKLIAQVW